ncbi:MAG: gamma-glutamylcyclotransferase [Burkholderiaceae bacterium]
MDRAQASRQVDWVFAYGSLIWNPEIDFDRAELVKVHGFHRAFCIRSIHHRGTPERPGVVLGLDRGGSCVGMAFRLRPETRAESIDILYEREMQYAVYIPTLVGAALADGTRIRALTFVANRANNAYQRLAEDEILQRMRCCAGQRGANVDYLINTWRSLQQHGVHDEMLARLAQNAGSEVRPAPPPVRVADPGRGAPPVPASPPSAARTGTAAVCTRAPDTTTSDTAA